jgi:farnesyl-diphosphate farnesyltransferase
VTSAQPRPVSLQQLLARVSRSFYLSVRVLPRSLRRPVGLAYLFCRAADTMADTALVSREQRLACLHQYREVFHRNDTKAVAFDLRQQLSGHQADSADRELLTRLPECFSVLSQLPETDQHHIRTLVMTLTRGMEMDLTRFPAEDSGMISALETRAELDLYTYFVAGCVGEFWTRLAVAHRGALRHWDLVAMEERGVRFGKGLQLTNILRDLAQDVRLGRCYLPYAELIALGVRPEELLERQTINRVRPLLNELLDVTLTHYGQGWAYTLAIPRREWWLRLACAWPLLIGLSTLTLLRHSPQLLDPGARVKITRLQVYRLLVRSVVTVWSNHALDQHYEKLRTKSYEGELRWQDG